MFKTLHIKQGNSSAVNKWTFLFMVKNFIFLTLLAGAVQAAYVTDNFNITLRAEPLKSAPVVTLLKNGTKLEVLEENEGWVHVKIEDGKEGWIVKRYVSLEIPQSIRIEKLGKSLDETSIKLKVTAEKAAAIGENNKTLKRELESTREKLNQVDADYKRLQADSGNVVEIKKNYEESTVNLSRAMAKIEGLQAENNELRSTTEFRWFLTGAGVVAAAWIVGFIMGSMNRGKRHHSPFIN
ncbi:MAG: TIGR04211 family SH3 domain-containing protein [Deltaproteobacteria bacterium]|nr:TIGR04211 family SH3 domain-containing protein [Deltaproteobacteria bacterium]